MHIESSSFAEEEPFYLELVPIERVRFRVLRGQKRFAAIEDVQQETGKTRSSLSSQYDRLKANPHESHGNRLLTLTQEYLILIILIGFSVHSDGITASYLVGLIKKTWAVTVTASWVSRFLKRNQRVLAVRKTKLLADGRHKDISREEVMSFVSSFKAIVKLGKVAADNIVNYDETSVIKGSDGVHSTEFRGRSRYNRLGTRNSRLCSMLPFVAGDGIVHAIFYILAIDVTGLDDEEEVDIPIPFYTEGQKPPYPRYYCFTKTGYMNKELFPKVMRTFMDLWNTTRPGREVFVFGDQLGSHINIELAREGIEKKVYLWLFPANCSHFIQTLDSLVFASFKRALKDEMQKATWDNNNMYELRPLMFAAMYKAEERSLKPSIITASWRKTGMWPFKPKKIITLLEENLGKCAKILDKFTQKLVQTVGETMDTREEATKARLGAITVRRSNVRVNGLHKPELLVEFGDQQAASKAALEQEKVLRKRQRGELIAAKVAARDALLCQGCKKKHFRGGATWTTCNRCNSAHFCKSCKTSHMSHERECDGESSPEL